MRRELIPGLDGAHNIGESAADFKPENIADTVIINRGCDGQQPSAHLNPEITIPHYCSAGWNLIR